MTTLGLSRGKVKLLLYQPGWKVLFVREKKRLKRALGDLAVDIQHVGSTSIPQMTAKPIIDINVGVTSLKTTKAIIHKLTKLGYHYLPDRGIPDTRLFLAHGSDRMRTFYLHLTTYAGEEWNKQLFFRDYLQRHHATARKYVALKKKLAVKFKEQRELYTAGKAEFIAGIVKKMKNSK